MQLSIILNMLNFQFFKTLDSTYSRLYQRLPKSFKAVAISFRPFLKSMRDGNLYLGPLQIIERILESEIIFKFPVIICIFQFQLYIDKVVTRKFRVALSKLRHSSHRVLIESGRWNRPQPIPREQRLCAICNNLEDEYHLLFECPLYNNERVAFLKPYYRRPMLKY